MTTPRRGSGPGLLSGLVAALLLLAAGLPAGAAETALTDYAWSENAGYLRASHGIDAAAPKLADGAAAHLKGYLWGENIGWVKLGAGTGPYANTSASTWGVNVAAAGAPSPGALTGRAWSETIGWIVFDPVCQNEQPCGGGALDWATGNLSGYVWSENAGWLHLAGGVWAGGGMLYTVGTVPVASVADVPGAGGSEVRESACSLSFAVTLNKPPIRNSSIQVDFVAEEISPPSAVAGVDFTAAAGSIAITGPTATTGAIPVGLVNDRTAGEGDEFLRVRLVLPSGAQFAIADGDAIGTVTDDDHTLRVVVTGDGRVSSGVVTGSPSCDASGPPSLVCTSDCTAVFTLGESVPLTAAATAPPPGTPPSSFVGWSGGGCSGTGPCTVTIAGAVTVTARFERDTDGDGVPDTTDNCIDVPNPDQDDTDGDGRGDRCDGDVDGDGVADAEDNCPTVANPDQTDLNLDDRGDACQVKLADSGQIFCTSAAGGLIPCPAAGAALSGQDAAYPLRTRSFTDNGDSTVTDAVTGLTWQNTASVSYNWYQATGVTNAVSNAAGMSVCGSLPLGGHADWRLPTRQELSTLVDPSAANPATFTASFPGAASGGYWTVDRVPTTVDGWGLLFTNGAAALAPLTTTWSVRCVRGPALSLTHRLVNNGDGTVTDVANGVMWQAMTARPGKTRAQAESLCGSLTLADHDDWRLPSLRELVSVVDFGQFQPAVDLAYFPGTMSAPYWAADADVLSATRAWGVNFQSGSFLPQDRDTVHYVRCVRGRGLLFDDLAAGAGGVVIDQGTGLAWQQAHYASAVNWQQALAYCEALSLADHADWRLPSVKEASSIANTAAALPALSPLFASVEGTTRKFWTSSTDLSGPSRAWGVHFDAGHSYALAKGESHYARCVRGGFEGTLAVDIAAVRDLPDGGLAGRVTATPAGGNNPPNPIDCSVRPTAPGSGERPGLDAGQCTDIYGTEPPTVVTLTADPQRAGAVRPYLTAAGLEPSVFAGWSGDACNEAPALAAGASCTLEITGDVRVTATFRRDTDADRDDVWDSEDNCPTTYNPRQIDTDADGRGDACEARLPDTGQTGDFSAVFGEDADYLIHPPSYHGFAVRAASTISFHDGNPDRIVDAAGGFLTAGFEPGDTVSVQGSASGANDGSFTVAAVTASTLTLIDTDSLLAQPAGASVTLANALSGVVLDRNTRLIWQVQDNGSSSNWYRAAGVSGNAYNPASAAVDVCGTLSLGGFSDWRLPTRQELLTLVHYGAAAPAIAGGQFADTAAARYWTATSFPGDAAGATNAWSVDFSNGLSAYGDKGEALRVRCVRAQPLVLDGLAGNGGGTVTDAATGLDWQQGGAAAALAWADALSYCEGLDLGPDDDWRLPNIRELATIARDDLPGSPVADPLFTATAADGYWSSTTNVQNTSNAWFVDFANGSTSPFGPKNGSRRVRCVRGGRGGSLGSADLALGITDAPDPVVCGGAGCGGGSTNVTYAVQVRNLGPDDALGVTVVHTLPAGTAYAGGSWPAGSSCATDAGALVCAVPSIPADDEAVILVSVTPPAATGFFSLTASAVSLTNDAFAENNAAVEQTWAGIATNSLAVLLQGTGSGRVTGRVDPPTVPPESPAGIDCGGDCTEAYPLGTVVRLSAAADPFALFHRWIGGGCAGTGDCLVQVNAYTLMRAEFVLDSDGDGSADTRDNCAQVANPGQADLDFDGIGDACDSDADGDGVAGTDNCPWAANPSQADTDGDGVGDACEVRLADSGQTSGYTAVFGEDADYLFNPPAFRSAALITAASISFEDSNPDAIVDGAGGFVDAGFTAGDTVRVLGSAGGANDGAFLVAAVTAGRLTLAAGAALVSQVAGGRTTLTNGAYLSSVAVSFVPGNPAEILDNARGFVAAGFRAGDRVLVGGSLHGLNDGTWSVTGVSPERLVLGNGDALTAEPPRATLVSSGLSFHDTNPDTIRDAGGRFLSSGFAAGDRVRVSGATAGQNNALFTIAGVTEDTITLQEADALAGSASGPSVTVTEASVVTVTSLGGGTVLDRNTHLTWQRVAPDGSFGWAAASAYCGGLVLGGHHDWRIPTHDEAVGIVDYGRRNPALDTAFFPGAAGGPHWTGTYLDVATPVWVDADTGESDVEQSSTEHRVRCVRGGSPGLRSLPVEDEQTVVYGGTGLVWQRGDAQNAVAVAWEEALAYCEGLSLADRNDWRLPNVRELASLGDPARSPAIERGDLFTAARVDAPYWSSTTDTGAPGSAWVVTFSDGSVSALAKAAPPAAYIRCVRGGRSGAVGEADLRVVGAADRDPVIVGSRVDYTFTVVNDGWLPASGVSLTFETPPGAVAIDAGASQGSCVPAAGGFSCDLGELDAGAWADVTVGVTAPAVPGISLNRATAASATHDPVGGNNSATVAINVNLDDDADGVPDSVDNCPGVANADQLDTDGDGAGDACDTDDDADGVADAADNCRVTFNPDQLDTDGDGSGDLCDADRDGDGLADTADNCLAAFNPNQADTDADGIGDACEIKLPDTGQTAGSTDTFGEDADYDINPPRLRTLGPVVLDEHTGLLWQLQPSDQYLTRAQAAEACASLALGAYVGGTYGDWRLPTKKELLSLVSFGHGGPALDPAVFPGAETALCWTATDVPGTPGAGWAVDLFLGHAEPTPTSTPGLARCVRGRYPAYPDPAPAAAHSLVERATGLVWQTADEAVPDPTLTPMTWEQALGYCEGLQLDGDEDWRLPNARELESLFPDGADTAFLPGPVAGAYWSATTALSPASYAWSVSFANGALSIRDKIQGLGVRCVRGGIGGGIGNADLELLMQPGTPDPVTSGRDLTYLIDVTNLGPHGASGVVLTDTLPTGAVLKSAGWSGNDCTADGGVVSCALGAIPALGTVRVTLLLAAPLPAGDITNAARVTADSNDEDLANNEASDGSVTVQYELTVVNTGVGGATGTVVSTQPAGDFSCGADCTQTYPDATAVTLSATPDAGFFFHGWSGAGCSGREPCTVLVDGDDQVEAVFTPYRLTVAIAGDASGGVTTDPPGIDCHSLTGGVCQQFYLAPTVVTLSVWPDPGAWFNGWGPGVTGTAPWTIAVGGDVAVTAYFVIQPTIRVTPSSHDFGVVDVGTGPVSQTFTVSNTGTASLVLNAALAAGGAGAFGVAADSCSGNPVISGASCAVTIAFEPPAGGAFTGQLVLSSNDPSSRTLSVPLAGTGDGDPDGDGVPTGVDNCPWQANDDQWDWDLDALGDVCDNCPYVVNPDQADADGNGAGDLCGVVSVTATGQRFRLLPGDDGSVRAGLPAPAPRFTNPDGTVPIRGGEVLDNLTGLIWLTNANCIRTRYPSFAGEADGTVTWNRALAFVRGINAGTYPSCGAGNADWRLPNVNELETLASIGRASGDTWLAQRGFRNVFSSYWTSTAFQPDTAGVWQVNLADGGLRVEPQTASLAAVWPVRGEATRYAQLAATGQTASVRGGDDGSLERGVPWPSPRLTPLPDGTLKDELTGLFWAGSAGTPGPAACDPGSAKFWEPALAYVACLNHNGYLGHSDWRLPNRRELRTMVNYGSSANGDWLAGIGVAGVRALGYWTSSTNARDRLQAWFVDLRSGSLATRLKQSSGTRAHVWPVRGGVQ